MPVRRRRSFFPILFIAAIALCCAAPPRVWPFYPFDKLRDARMNMVDEYIVPEGIDNARVLYAMRHVERHKFVSRAYQKYAYFDNPLPIGAGQTISPPFIVAYMTQELDPQPDDKVLEVGTGSGYQAAVLAEIVDKVYTIEIVESLGKSARERLAELGYDNVEVKIGDGYQGWAEHAPFDKIIVTCSPEKIPLPLQKQLKEGGRMIIPVGERYQQVFVLLEKKDGKLVRTKLIPTLFVPMTGVSEKNRKVQPDPLHPEVVNGSFELDNNEDGKPDNWHYQRQLKLFSDGGTDGEHYIQIFNLEPGRFGQAVQGMALDGRSLGRLQVEASVAYQNLQNGLHRQEKPGILLHFFDSRRKLIDLKIVGPWHGSSDWKRIRSTVQIPPSTREMVMTIGLNGGTGRLFLDDVSIHASPR